MREHQSKKEGKDRESIQSSTTPDQELYGKVTKTQEKHHAHDGCSNSTAIDNG